MPHLALMHSGVIADSTNKINSIYSQLIIAKLHFDFHIADTYSIYHSKITGQVSTNSILLIRGFKH